MPNDSLDQYSCNFFGKSCLGWKQLDRLRSREETAVYGVDDWLGGDLSTTEETAVQTLDGILPTLDTVKLQVDITLGVRI